MKSRETRPGARTAQEAGTRTLLSIAGYDPSSGAGVLADVAVFRSLGFAGTGILTAVTAQNTRRVRQVFCLPPRFLVIQYQTLAGDIRLSGIKIGMVGCRNNLAALAEILGESGRLPAVADPVFRASSGPWLLEKAAVKSYLATVRGKISVLTPNMAEAELAAGRPVRSVQEMKEAARMIAASIEAPCLVKGGHLTGEATDVLFDGKDFTLFERKKIEADVHGTGCLLSSSLLCFLVRGHSLAEACALAATWTYRAILRSSRIGKGRPIALFNS
jgi:hydroxymethylpyrimidine/phosphomethylpyrimidine kinase